ncbi:MAG: tRNA ((1)-)-methyltransferase [Candidatus Saccharibacteria bacterium]|nr:tRNA ((1)-)-methyltransferase [Candidatus Saccharibacteria bacterium]
MRIQIITLFPEMFEGVLNSSMLWKAQKEGLVEYRLINLRDFGIGPRKQVDDTPYGGGDGMVLMPEPLFAAVDDAKEKDPDAQVLLMTPRGDLFNQELAREFAATQAGLIIICGRYEGYDERITTVVDKQLSIGNYVLTGGELPAMVVTDAVTRLVPGVLGGETSAEKESFSEAGVLEHPHYTRPEIYRGLKVPDVLLSGNHAEIDKWRADNNA